MRCSFSCAQGANRLLSKSVEKFTRAASMLNGGVSHTCGRRSVRRTGCACLSCRAVTIRVARSCCVAGLGIELAATGSVYRAFADVVVDYTRQSGRRILHRVQRAGRQNGSSRVRTCVALKLCGASRGVAARVASHPIPVWHLSWPGVSAVPELAGRAAQPGCVCRRCSAVSEALALPDDSSIDTNWLPLPGASVRSSMCRPQRRTHVSGT